MLAKLVRKRSFSRVTLSLLCPTTRLAHLDYKKRPCKAVSLQNSCMTASIHGIFHRLSMAANETCQSESPGQTLAVDLLLVDYRWLVQPLDGL
jgi:hypothetical protein